MTWDDLVEQPLINLSRATQVQQLITESLAHTGKPLRPVYEISFLHTALALAREGLGVVVIPGYYVQGNLNVSSLVAKKLHDPLIERGLLVHTRQGYTLSSPANTFLEMVKEHLHRLV